MPSSQPINEMSSSVLDFLCVLTNQHLFDQLHISVCFRGRDRLRVHNALCHRSHFVQDIGHHLTSTYVSTSYTSHYCPFLYLSTFFKCLQQLIIFVFLSNYFPSPLIYSGALPSFAFSLSNSNLNSPSIVLWVSLLLPLFALLLPSYQTNVSDFPRCFFPLSVYFWNGTVGFECLSAESIWKLATELVKIEVGRY